MFILGVLLYILVISFVTMFSTSLNSLVNGVSLIFVLGSHLSILILTKGYQDFIYGIKVISLKDTKTNEKDIKNSIEIFKVLFKTSISTGIISIIIGIISILHISSDISIIGPFVSIALVSMLYSIVIAFIIFIPVIFRLEKIRNNSR